MEKKYIVAVVAIVILWAAFMGFRHFRKQEETRAQHEDTYSRMIEMAKKSPRGGLYEMAAAIRRYQADFKVYPPSLDALYPKYMPSRAFIEQIAWRYEPGQDDFSLSKSVVYNNKTMVASIDSRMRPEVETGGVMVAKRAVPKAPAKAAVEEIAEAPEQAISENMVLEVIAEHEMTVKEADVVQVAASPERMRGDRPKETEKEINVQTELSRIITQVGAEAVSARDAEIGYDLEHYLVWKDPNGVLGISNVEFPERTDMYVAVRNRWYNVRRRAPERGTPTAGPDAAAAAQAPITAEEMAAGFSRNYLVWRNADGTIGVGDSQYPDSQPLVIASQAGWNKLDRPPPAAAADAGGDKTAAAAKPDKDLGAIAGDISKEYLVWRNADGTIGVGDSQYPDSQPLVIASQAGWNKLDRPPLAAADAGRDKTAAAAKPDRDLGAIAGDISREYLVWRNADGTIGVGDSQYPERKRLEVASRGEWSVRSQEPLPAAKQAESSTTGQGREETLQERLLAAGADGRYLMWKDKDGRIGFGNVAYPEFRNIAYIRIGGSWQKVVN